MNARAAHVAAVCLFSAALPLSIAGANIGWGVSALTLLWLRHRGDTVSFKGLRSPILAPLAVFLAASLLASSLGVSPAASLRYFHQDAHKLWIACLCLTVLAAPKPRAIALSLAAGFSIATAIGIFQTLVPALSGSPEMVRAHAFVHPVTFGEQTALGLLGAFCFFLRPPPEENAAFWRRGGAMLAVLLGSALLLSNTRGAILAATAGFFAIFFAAPDKRRFALLAVPAGACLLLVAEFIRWDRSVIRELLEYYREGGPLGPQFARFSLWRVSAQIGVDHLWTGVGHNAFRIVFPDYFHGRLDGSADWGSGHNLYLHHFAERGLLGLSALIWLFWVFAKRAYDRVAANPDGLNLWALGATAAFFVMNLTEVALQVEIVWMLFFFIWCWAETSHINALVPKNSS